MDLSMFIDSDLFLLLLESWVLGLFYVRSHVKLMIYSACCKSVRVEIILKIYLLCQFSLYADCYTNSTFLYLFSFDEPRSISDLGLNRDLRTIEYGEIWKCCLYWIYMFGKIDGITWNWDLSIIVIIKVCKFG